MKTIIILVLTILSLLVSSCSGRALLQETTAEDASLSEETGVNHGIPDLRTDSNPQHTEPPESSSTAKWVFPDTVPIDEFLHSEYLLLVSTTDASMYSNFHALGFLGEGIANINEGFSYYERLDSLYRKPIQSNVFDALYHWLNAEPDPRGGPPNERELSHFSTCHVSFVSVDGTRVLCTSLWYENDGVVILGEVYEGAALVCNGFFPFETSQISIGRTQEDVFPNLSGYLSEGTALPFGENSWSPVELGNTGGFLFNPQETKYIERNDLGNGIVTVRSFPSRELISMVTLPPPVNPWNYVVLGLTVDDRVVLGFDGAVYSASFDGNDMKELANGIFDLHSVSLSPDGMYLAYSSPTGFGMRATWGMPNGIFIKQLETGKTAFYELYPASDTDSQFNIVGWVRKSGVEALMTGMVSGFYHNPIDSYFLPRIDGAKSEVERRELQDSYRGVWIEEFGNIVQWLGSRPDLLDQSDLMMFQQQVEDIIITTREISKNLMSSAASAQYDLDMFYWGNGLRSSLNQIEGELYSSICRYLIDDHYQFIERDYSEAHFE